MSRELAVRSPLPSLRAATMLASGVLWLTSAFLTVSCVFALREIVIWTFGFLLTDPRSFHNYQAVNAINLASMCSFYFFGIVALAVMLAVVDEVFKHADEPRLVRRLMMLVTAESALVVPVAVIFWGF